MTIVKGSTRKGQELINRASYNLGTNLRDVYSSGCSRNKEAAMDQCWWWYKNSQNSRNMRIISKNSFGFSVAWEMDFEYMNPKTGEITIEPATRIETKDNTYIVMLNR